ncbi:MAG: MBOAT family O-acyltransferase [Gammaproteobacteria bacterium]
MLFSSQVFILLFLPLTLAAYYLLPRLPGFRLALIVAASFVFYAWWDLRFVPLLAALIAANWLLARWYVRAGRGAIISAGVAANLAVLGLFKYVNFLAESALGLAGVAFEPWTIVLPLGISFFTFQQIAYLADLRRGQAPVYGLLDYAAYVSFFPQLIAGPIVRHNELIPQFRARIGGAFDAELAARGLVLFILGLAKKVFLADELAPVADVGFDALAAGSAIDGAVAWQSALAYSLQLYFDFSAYSDMAMGLAGLFGFDLPLNFDRPYAATSIREFWRRWHMTLSRFLRDYVYIPLGGSRQGLFRTYAMVLVTMLLCGLWHGAGWTFVAWGGLHGLAVCVNRAWLLTGRRLPPFAGQSLTLAFVVVGWVLFRAEAFSVARDMLVAMFSGAWTTLDDEAWPLIGVGWALALFGPTNVEAARSAWVTRRAVAAVLGVALVAVCLRVGQGRGLEFIYFQF